MPGDDDDTSSDQISPDEAIAENSAPATSQDVGVNNEESGVECAVSNEQPIENQDVSAHPAGSTEFLAASDNVDVETIDKAPDTIPNASPAVSRRKFRVTGIFFPGDDISHPEIVGVMQAAQSFHLWLERDQNKPQSRKKGGISFSFDDEDAARQAYCKIKDIVINGVRLKTQAPKSFDEFYLRQTMKEQPAVVEVPLEPDDPERLQKLYVDQLVPSADQDLIFAIFGKENLKDVDVRVDKRKSDGSKCAVLTFHDRDSAEQAKQEYDEFTVDDGDVSRPMRILLYVEYLRKIETERLNKLRPVSAARPPKLDALNDSSQSRVSRRLVGEQKGKAGNLWSAQIAVNRGEITESSNPKDRGVRDAEHNSSSTAPSAALDVQSHISLSQTGNKSLEPDPPSVTQAAPPPPPPPEEEAQVGHEYQMDLQPATGELNALELAVLIETFMEHDRVNWAELNTLEDMWALVHNASKNVGWQPELSLKEAMAVVLDRAYRAVGAEWQRDHLSSLIKIWKKELDVDSRSHIRKQLQLSELTPASVDPNGHAAVTSSVPGADYTPPPSDKPNGRRRNKATKKALMHMMGVGALLADVKKDAIDQEESRATGRKKAQQQEKKRKHSASESGEASTTTEEEAEEGGEPSDWEEGTVSSSDYRRQGKKGQEKRPPTKTQQRRKQNAPEPKPTDSTGGRSASIPNVDQFSSWMTTMMQSMGGGTNVQQQWMTQAMPMMMQMMPMMAQMMQAQRMMAAATASSGPTQQQMQQQMLQTMQQMMGSLGNQSSTRGRTPAQQSTPSAGPNQVSPWTQAPFGQSNPINPAPSLPPSSQGQYFGHHQPPPPPPPHNAGYGSTYGGRSGEQISRFQSRGNYALR